MSEEHYLGMRPGDLEGKPYAKYWNPEMRPLPEHVQDALSLGIQASQLGFPITEANQLLAPGYLPLETGYTRLDNGQIMVAMLTKMPGVTGKMIDWWFGWEAMETQRYKLWYPHAHLAASAEKMNGDDPDLSDREKYLHNPNYVTEYVANETMDLEIIFSEPSVFFDESRFEEAKIGTAICATVGMQNSPLNSGLLIHLIRETDDGCEMRSRFWLGNVEVQGLPSKGILNRIAGTKLVSKHAVPDQLGRDMVVHCAMEMNHLAGFLPVLYTDSHPETPLGNRDDE